MAGKHTIGGGDAVSTKREKFNSGVVAFERLAALCNDVGNRTVGQKVRRTTVEVAGGRTSGWSSRSVSVAGMF